jgi:hypothetical protein
MSHLASKLKNILAVFLAVIFSLYLSEFILIAFSPSGVKADDQYQTDDTSNPIKLEVPRYSSKYSTYNHLGGAESNIVMSIFSRVYLDFEAGRGGHKFDGVFPLAGFPNLNTLLCNEGEGPVTYIADNYGFRNNQNFDNYTIILTGDSFTHGVCVHKGIAENLNDHGVRTLNLGMSGAGPLSAFAAYREYNKKSKYILYVYHENDWSDLNIEKRTPLIKYFDLSYTQNLANRKNEIVDRLNKVYAAELRSLLSKDHFKSTSSWMPDSFRKFVTLHHFRRLVSRVVASKSADEEFYDIALMEQVLLNFRNLANQNNQEFVVVFAPEISRFYLARSENYRGKKILFDLLNKAGIKVIDFTPTAARYDYADLYDTKGTAHYSGFGYKVLSELVLAELFGKKSVVNTQ